MVLLCVIPYDICMDDDLQETIGQLAWPNCFKRHVSRSVVPGAQSAFQFLRDCCTPSGSETLGSLCVSLYVSLEFKKAQKLDRTIGLCDLILCTL